MLILVEEKKHFFIYLAEALCYYKLWDFLDKLSH